MRNEFQGSAEFFRERVGCLTASNMWRAMQFLKNGSEGAERRGLKIELLAERMTGDAVPHFVTPAMQWGIDQEAVGKRAFEEATGEIIRNVGFIRHPAIENCGASPDGFIGDDRGFELKCPTTAKHLTWWLAGVVPEEHKPQMLLGMACTGRKSWEFASFDPRLPPKQRLFIRTFTPKTEEIDEVEAAAVRFLKEVEAMFDQITEAA